MTLYTCELLRIIDEVKHQNSEFSQTMHSVTHRYVFVFELLSLKQNQKLNKNEHPIRVHLINGKIIVNGYAVAFASEWHYMGFTLYSILLNGIIYITYKSNYWFPSYPQKLVDGSLRVCLAKTKDTDIVFLTPLNVLPSMDVSGTFVYQYKMVSILVEVPRNDESYKNDYVFPELDRPVTLYQSDNKFNVLVDNLTMEAYCITDVMTFYEMPIYIEKTTI